MRTLFTFILGMLSGWLIEWLIDYLRWRGQPVRTAVVEVKSPPSSRIEPDDLKAIKGIGVVIERKLNEAGICTFEQLGKLTSDDLRGILGKRIQRLAEEESILQQARNQAKKK